MGAEVNREQLRAAALAQIVAAAKPKKRKPSVPRGESPLSVKFRLQLRANKIDDYTLEHKLHPARRWKFDIAFEWAKIAVEIEGGVFTRGRHTRPMGFMADCEKYNTAALMGWKVLRIHTRTINNGQAIKMLVGALENQKGENG